MERGKVWVIVAIYYMMIAILIIMLILGLLIDGIAQGDIEFAIGVLFISLFLLPISAAIFYYIPRSASFPIIRRFTKRSRRAAVETPAVPGPPTVAATTPVAYQWPQMAAPPEQSSVTPWAAAPAAQAVAVGEVDEEPLALYDVRTMLLAFLATTILGSVLLALGAALPLLLLPAFALIVASPIFPALMWISYVHHNRTDMHLRRTIILTTIMGGMLAIIVPFLVNTVVGAFSEFLAFVVSPPLIEELSKALMLLLVVKHIRSRFDGLFYGVTLGMGFAMAENLLYELNHLMSGGSAIGLGFMALARGLTGTIGHGVYTGIFGYMLGVHLESKAPSDRAVLVYGYLGAVALHMTWNGLLASGVAVVILLVFIVEPILLFYILRYLYRKGIEQERRDVGMGAVTPVTPTQWPPPTGASVTLTAPALAGQNPPPAQAPLGFVPGPTPQAPQAHVATTPSQFHAAPPQAFAQVQQTQPVHAQYQTTYAPAQAGQYTAYQQSSQQLTASVGPAPATKRFCISCGSPLTPDHKFCEHCGRPTNR